MAEYSFTPQFANLAGIQPLPAIDVTRGGALQFQPLQAIEVPSARPELVGVGIASAIERIGSGVLSGITAKYEEKKEAEREQLEHERQLELYGAKKRSENQEFYERERARFIATEGSKPGFKKKLEAFDSAMEGFKSRTPDVKPIKEEEEEAPPSNEIVEPELPEQPLTADFVTVPEEMAQARPGVFGFSILEEKKKPLAEMQPPATPTVVEETAPLAPLAPPKAEKKPATAVDYTEYPQPPAPSQQFETDAEAQNVAAELNNQLRGVNPDYRYEVIGLGKPDEWKTVVPVSIRDERIKREEAAISGAKEEERAVRSEQREEKSLQLEEAESQQKMELAAQKKKDAPSILWKAAEDNGLLLKEINLILNTIEEDESVLGPGGYAMSLVPMTKSREVRDSLDTIISKMTLGSLQNLREASPTGGALGNVSDKDISILRDAAGKINLNSGRPETVKAKLNDFKRKFEIIQKKLVSDPNWDVEQYPIPYTDWGIDKKPQKFTKINDSKSNASNALIKEKDELLQKMTSGSEEYKASEQYKKDRDRVKEILQQIQ